VAGLVLATCVALMRRQQNSLHAPQFHQSDPCRSSSPYSGISAWATATSAPAHCAPGLLRRSADDYAR